ncbi:MAG: hypothetical protein H7Y18_14150 [Clostridiaceae bacterium]|nr:hypothetical protein [Clostridiaceae bacterium]
MKKSIVYLILIIMLINMTACSSNKQKAKSEESKFDIKKAEGLIDNYMVAMITENEAAMNKFLSEKLLKTTKTMEKSKLKVKGYNIAESNEVGDTGIFKVKVASTSLESSRSSLDTYTFKVILESFNYKIGEVKTSLEKECYYENYGLRVRNKNDVESKLLIDSDGIPQYGFAKEDKSQASKLELPRTNFQNIIFAYSGDNLAISLINKIAFIGIVRITTDSMQTAANQSGGGQSSGGSQPGGSSETEKNMGPREKPVGKELTAVDVLKDCKIDFMVFSSDEKFVLVQYTNIDNRKCLRLYTADKGDLVSFKFEENYNVSNLDIKYSHFAKDILYYEVVPKDDKKEIEKQVEGMWQLDLKKFKAKKV